MTKVKHFHHHLKIGMLSTFLVIPPARPVPSLIYVRHQFVGKPSICDVLLMYISKIKHKLHSWISGSETSMNMFNNIESEALGTEKWEKPQVQDLEEPVQLLRLEKANQRRVW